MIFLGIFVFTSINPFGLDLLVPDNRSFTLTDGSLFRETRYSAGVTILCISFKKR